MKKQTLIKSSLVYTLGTLLLQGLNFITLPIYTRVISQEVFGQYSLYTSWVGLFSLVIGLQTSGSFVTAKIKFEEEYDSYVSHALTVSTAFAFACLSLVFLFRTALADWLGFSEMILLLIVIQSYFGYVTGLFGTYFITYQKATANFFLSAFTAVTTVGLSLYWISNWQDHLMARILGNFIPLFIATFVAIVFIYTKGKTFFCKDYLGFTLTVSLPLIFHHLGHQVLNQMDRIMIGKMMTTKDVALYSFGYNLGLLISLVLLNLNTAWTPWFFEAKKKGYAKLNDYILRYLAVAVFLTLGYLTIYPELALLMGGSRYAESINFIPLIIVSYFVSFLYTFPVNIQFYHANTKTIPVGTLFAGLVNIGLNWFLIPIIGIYGAALATVLSYLALLFFHHMISRKRYAYTDVRPKTYIFLILLVMSYAGLMSLFVPLLWLRWLIGFGVILLYIYWFRKELREVWQSYKQRRN